jgi:hypothetical protein
MKKPLCATKGDRDMPFRTSGNFRNDVDMDRAKDCAEHFGKCSVKEMQQLKHGKDSIDTHVKSIASHLFFSNIPVFRSSFLLLDLHKKRSQDLDFGQTTISAPEDTFEERLIEQLELSLQLNLLQEEMPPSYLFPKAVDGPMEELPHLTDGTVAAKVKQEEQTMVLGFLMDEEVLESLAICALIGALIMARQVLL